MNPHIKEICRIFERFNYRFSRHEIFRDFCAFYALSLRFVAMSNLDELQGQEYIRIKNKYSKEDFLLFCQIESLILDALTASISDVLGQVYMQLEISNSNMGQFFTPPSISRLMAQLTVGDMAENPALKRWGFIQMSEPTVGAGGMVLEYAEVMREQGLNPQRQLHVLAQDLDIVAVYMSYIQFSLAGIPAVILHGNSLNPDDVRSVWHTIMHVKDGWRQQLNRKESAEKMLNLLRTVGNSANDSAPVPEREQVYSIDPPDPIILKPAEVDKLEELKSRRRSQIVDYKKGLQLGLF